MQQVSMRASGPDELFGIGPLEQHGGAITGSMHAGPWTLGADGRPAVGALGVLADNVLGYAVMASLTPGSWSISTEIWIDLVGPVPTLETKLTAEAVPSQAGSFSLGRIIDEHGRPVAECRQRGR